MLSQDVVAEEAAGKRFLNSKAQEANTKVKIAMERALPLAGRWCLCRGSGPSAIALSWGERSARLKLMKCLGAGPLPI